jgi:Cyclic nucleotide-binding domain
LLGRVFGVLETAFTVAVGVGSAVTPAMIAILGTRGALVAIGIVCPAFAALGWARMWTLDRTLAVRSREIALLRAVPMLRVLPSVTIEQLARSVRTADVPAGESLCIQGETGDTFYVIESGDADVLSSGRVIRTLGPGDHFGEIALLRDVPRTATVRARTEIRTSSLSRDVFIPLISGYGASSRAAEAEIGERLAELNA